MSDPVAPWLEANAQREAADTAANSQAAANAQNFQMFNLAHGSGGSAQFPLYLKGVNGGLFEPQLGSDLTAAYSNNAVPLSTFQAAVGKTAPANASANDLTNSIFNGGVTAGMKANAAPVQAARTATARSSALDALNKTLDSIDAGQAGRGYVGDDYGSRLLKFQAGQAAGTAIGQADVANKQQTADITNYGNYTLPLQNMQLPYSMAQQNSALAFMPQDQELQSIGQRMQPLNMLKIGYTGPFQYQPLPTPGPGAFSGLAGSLSSLSGGAGQGMGAAMQMYQQAQASTAAQSAAQNNSGGAYSGAAMGYASSPYLYNAANGGAYGLTGSGVDAASAGSADYSGASDAGSDFVDGGDGG